MAKRKYSRMGETPVAYECTKTKCKWQGTGDQKASKRFNAFTIEHICPVCGNNEFYGLLELPKVKQSTHNN